MKIASCALVAYLTALSAQEPTPYTKQVRWSVSCVHQTLMPGEQTVVEETFRSTVLLKNVRFALSDVVEYTVGLEPKEISEVLPNTDIKVRFSFNARSGAWRDEFWVGNVLGRAEGVSGERLWFSPLPVVFKVDTVSKKVDFSSLAAALQAEPFDKTALGKALAWFSPAEQGKAVKIFSKFTAAERREHATMFRQAWLVHAWDDSRIYRTVFLPADDQLSKVEFTLFKNLQGRWVITDW